jgi:hypothetical protein
MPNPTAASSAFNTWFKVSAGGGCISIIPSQMLPSVVRSPISVPTESRRASRRDPTPTLLRG